MRYEYIEPFVTSTIKVLDTVIQTDIAKGAVSLVSGGRIIGDVAIIVRIQGDSDGSIVLNMQEETALNICSVMFGDSAVALTPREMDSIAELANMIAGNATSVLNDMGYDLQVLPPLIITKEHSLRGAARLEAFQVPLYTEYGEIMMHVALRTN